MNGFWIAMVGVGVATLLSGIGSSIGVGIPARAAAGVLSEQPDRFGRTFILVVLPSTQGFYGFIAAMFMMMKLGMFSGSVNFDMEVLEGIRYLMAALPVAILGLVSAIHQSLVCTSGVELAAKQPEATMRVVIFAVMVETYAILGFVTSFLMINAIG
ncbi:MAG: V-type ATP synthase subunit K [candidate division WOR-3 bacterium]|nr:V-type ATP synthase subunit K [candidate division WOR-3 bacterium]